MFKYKIPSVSISIVLIYIFSIFSLPPLNMIYYDQKVYSQTSTNISFPSSVKIKGLIIHVDLAITTDQQEKGLSVKNNMSNNEGMLFPFNTPGDYSFWMKDMKFPLDIIWINSNGKIVHIEKNLQPCSFILFCPSYSPPANSNSKYVLEVNANYTTKNNINVGDKVSFNNNNSTNSKS
jgi:uncharacterized protein